MKLMIARVYDKILEESKIEPVAKKGEKLFIGHLFFEPTEQEIEDIMEEIEISDNSSDVEIAKAFFPLYKKYDLLASDGSSFSCCVHWSWANGLAEKLDDNWLNYLKIKDSEVESIL